MPRSDLTPQRQDVPDDPIKLPDGWRACRSCGIAVQAHEDSDSELLIHLSSAGRAAEGPGALTQAVQQQQQIQLTFSLCPSCRRIAELAERLIPPPANAIAVHQLTCALDGLHFLAPTSIENVTDQTHLAPEDLAGMVRALANLGALARWSSRFVPVIAPDADPQTCSPYAWAHVKMGQRQALRSAYAGLLKERVARTAPPVKIPPPPVTDRANTLPVETGCLMCGISHESVPAVTVAREVRADIARWIWTPKRVSPTQLGGQGPQQLSGFLCQSCAGAVEHVRSIGPTALERALVSALMPQGLGKLGWGQAVMEALLAGARLQLPGRRRRTSGPGRTWVTWPCSANISGGDWVDQGTPSANRFPLTNAFVDCLQQFSPDNLLQPFGVSRSWCQT